MKVKSKMCFAFITYGLCNLPITVEAFFKYTVFFLLLFWHWHWHCPLFNVIVQAQFPADVFPSCVQGNLTWDISGVFDIAVNVFLIDILALITYPTPTFISQQLSITTHLRRSVRSTLHFSPKNLQISKWSYTKNGSKHPMFSISMAYNVISYKKIQRNAQKTKINDFAM